MPKHYDEQVLVERIMTPHEREDYELTVPKPDREGRVRKLDYKKIVEKEG